MNITDSRLRQKTTSISRP